MKTFHDFLKEEKDAGGEEMASFIKDNNLEKQWKQYQNRPKPITAPPYESQGWELKNNEIMRDINAVFRSVINSSVKENRFGVEEIKFEIINDEKVSTGVQLNLEAEGVAFARNPDHIKRLLAQLNESAKKALWQHGIKMEFLYNRLDVSEAQEEGDVGPVGLVRKYSFRVICSAVANTQIHGQVRH
jgi:hypothetical protein